MPRGTYVEEKRLTTELSVSVFIHLKLELLSQFRTSNVKKYYYLKKMTIF